MSPTITPAVRKKILDAALAAERDPSADLTIAMLAEYAGMSDKHFQRCFRVVLGESPKNYVRRLRLQIAAYLLKWSDAPIVHLAIGAGFETHAGFTKAFSKLYGVSPLQFRNATDLTPFLEFPRKHPKDFNLEAAQSTQLAVRIKNVPDRRLAVMRTIGPTSKMATIWLKMIDWSNVVACSVKTRSSLASITIIGTPLPKTIIATTPRSSCQTILFSTTKSTPC